MSIYNTINKQQVAAAKSNRKPRVWINISHFAIHNAFKRTCNSKKLINKQNCDIKNLYEKENLRKLYHCQCKSTKKR